VARVNALFAVFRDIVLLRRGPQDLPYAPGLLIALLLLSLMISLGVAGLAPSAPMPLGRALFSLGMMLLLPALALRMADRSARFVQTATALAGADVALTLLAIPILLGVGQVPEDTTQTTALQVACIWLLLAQMVFHLVVRASILRHALEVPLRAGMLLSVAFFVIELVLVVVIFGQDVA
jgi:hypothetical protein